MIYLVIADEGLSREEYETHIVCAYADQALADAHAQQAQKCGNEVWTEISGLNRAWCNNDITYDEYQEAVNREGNNPYDSEMSVTQQTRYGVKAIALRTRLPTSNEMRRG